MRHFRHPPRATFAKHRAAHRPPSSRPCTGCQMCPAHSPKRPPHCRPSSLWHAACLGGYAPAGTQRQSPSQPASRRPPTLGQHGLDVSPTVVTEDEGLGAAAAPLRALLRLGKLEDGGVQDHSLRLKHELLGDLQASRTRRVGGPEGRRSGGVWAGETDSHRPAHSRSCAMASPPCCCPWSSPPTRPHHRSVWHQ